MSLTAVTPSTNVELQLVSQKIKLQLNDNQPKASIHGNVALKPAPLILQPVKKAEEGKFTITFSYNQQLHCTKVQLSGTKYGTPVYKVALTSRLSEEGKVIWLKKKGSEWEAILGGDINNSLRKIIISAIEDQE